MDKPNSISYYEHEAEIARVEVHSRRWAIAALLMFIALICTNLGWIVYEMQYQDVVMTENQLEGEGVNILSNGDVTYGNTSENR